MISRYTNNPNKIAIHAKPGVQSKATPLAEHQVPKDTVVLAHRLLQMG